MRFKNELFPLSLTLAMAGLVGCGAGVEGTSEDGAKSGQEAVGGAADDGSLGTREEALTSADISCGHEASFPTWAAWGETTLDMTNLNPSAGPLSVRYKAGWGEHVDLKVATFERVKGRWGGFDVTVTVLGYGEDANYKACLHNTENPGAPSLRVQSY